MELTSDGNTNEDVPVVNRTMHVPSAVTESINVKLAVLVPSIEQLPEVTTTAEALGSVEKLGKPKVKNESKRMTTVERAMRGRRTSLEKLTATP
jgi:hypothetical protein